MEEEIKEENFGRRNFDKFMMKYFMQKLDEMDERITDIQKKINNGMSDRIYNNEQQIDNLWERYHMLIWALGGGMFAIIVLLLTILSRVW